MIFVSYCQKDKSIVQRICRNIKEKGIRFFADYEQLAGGDYAQELTKRIEAAEAILFFYSENTENSTWVKHEIEFALSKRKSIVPVLLPESEESSWLHFHLGNLRWIYIEEKNLNSISEEIVNALKNSTEEMTVNISTEPIIDINNNTPKDAQKLTRKKRNLAPITGFGCLVILFLIVFVLYFTLSHMSSSRPNFSSDDTISSPNKECRQTDFPDESVSGRQEYDYTHDSIETGTKKTKEETEDEMMDKNDKFHDEKHTNIENDTILNHSVRQEEDDLLEPTIEELQPHFYDSILACPTPINTEAPFTYSIPYFWLYILTAFLAGCGIMVVLLKIKRPKKDNIKLSSDIASKISIDGDLQKEIESREV